VKRTHLVREESQSLSPHKDSRKFAVKSREIRQSIWRSQVAVF